MSHRRDFEVEKFKETVETIRLCSVTEILWENIKKEKRNRSKINDLFLYIYLNLNYVI